VEKVGEVADSADRRGKRRRGKADEEEDRPLLGGREQRQLRRKQTGQREEGEETPSTSRPIRRITRRNKRTGVNTAAPRKERIALELPCTVREFSEAAGVPAAQILRILMQEGVMTTITAELDQEMAEFVAAELGIDIDFKKPVSLEDELLSTVWQQEDIAEELEPRPPVITFLGHVDHGKTSLLDKIIGIDVVSGESGGITQHIRAYQVDHDGRRISFVDTPGHEAFTEMRARGANVTDIAVLVVAADDGVMPQTEEAISHARAAEVPIVVALNKIDLPGVDPNRTLQQLAANDLLPSEWGGDVEVIRTSAVTGAGIEDLLETVLTVAELHEYRANPRRTAYGTSLEAQQEAGRGVVAKLIVQNGTLHVGDILVCGEAYGKVKAMFDSLKPNLRVDGAGPSATVNVTGLDVAPEAGEHFYVLDDIAQAREIAEARAVRNRREQLTGGIQHVTLENLFDRLEGASEVQMLNIILRADVRGSIEAIEKELTKLQHPEVKIKLLQKSVGGITEADVMLAHASDAIVIGFNVVPDENARLLAERKGVQIRRYDVIYKITDDLKLALEGMLRPEEREVDLGRALVQQTFKISRVGTVAGCRVLSGNVERNGRVRVIRENTIIGDYPIDTLRREKDDAREVREGLECGIKLAGFNDLKEGDLLEVYKVEEVGRKFEATAAATT
jgi:translation initiation factor IF-2